MKAKHDCPSCGRRGLCQCEWVEPVFETHEEWHAPADEAWVFRDRAAFEHRIALREIERNRIEELRAIRRERREEY